MRRRLLLCVALLAFTVTVGCNRDSNKQAQSNNPPADQSASQAQPPAEPAQPPAAEQQQTPPPPPPEPATEKPATTTKKPTHTAKAPAAAAGATAAAGTQAAATQAAPPKPPEPVAIVVPAGTVLDVRIDQPISTKTNKAGDTFTATLSDAVAVNGAVVIPRGARIAGVVADSESAGKFKGSAKLALQLTKVGVGNAAYPITASLAQEGKGRGKRSAVTTGGGAGAGALIGGIAGGGKGAAIGALVGGGAGAVGGAMTGERDISLPAEQSLSFKLEQPVKVLVPPPQNAAQ